jgi:ComF family protein
MRSVLALAFALLRMLLAAVRGALGPPTCAACDARVRFGVVFCSACAATITPSPPSEPTALDGASPRPLAVHAFGSFGGALATALRRLKYQDRPDLGAPLGHLARRTARLAGLTADLVVPVPLHPRRLVERGYNQAALLAAEVAIELGAPLAARALVRVRHTPQQARADRASRLDNVREAFRARRPASLRGRRVVLVDDVATTGSTLTACAEALLAAGAASVTAVVIARA